MRFQDRVAVITGGAKGIGLGCTEVFLEQGGLVAILDRDQESLDACCEEMETRYPGRTIGIKCDVSVECDWTKAIESVVERFQRIDALINNAGIHPPDTPIEKMIPAEAMRVMQVNFASTYAGCYYTLTHLRKTRGCIVNISSMTAVLGQKNSTAYSASKGAQISFTKSLALELAGDGIRVNAILPSNVDTPLMHQWANSLPDPEAALERIAKLQPLGRMAAPREIGTVALFLCTEDSSFITGQAIEADGGAALDY